SRAFDQTARGELPMPAAVMDMVGVGAEEPGRDGDRVELLPLLTDVLDEPPDLAAGILVIEDRFGLHSGRDLVVPLDKKLGLPLVELKLRGGSLELILMQLGFLAGPDVGFFLPLDRRSELVGFLLVVYDVAGQPAKVLGGEARRLGP